MRKQLIYLLFIVFALLGVGCAVEEHDATINPEMPPQAKPTVPIKRRPIVPSSQLPRPRIIIEVSQELHGAISVLLAPEVTSATLSLRSLATGDESCVTYFGDVTPEFPALEPGMYTLHIATDSVDHTETIEVL